MANNQRAVVLNVELLEDRCTPSIVGIGPGLPVTNFSPQAFLGAGPAVPVNNPSEGAFANTAATPTLSLALLPMLSTPIPIPATTVPSQLPLVNILPFGAGSVPVDNSIPNAAQVLASSAGLAVLSPFLPTYYPTYTQVGPVYTGSDVALPPKSSLASYAPTAHSADTPTDAADSLPPETVALDTVFAEAWLAALTED